MPELNLTDFYKKKLKEQLSFIESSCKRYDEGFHEESLRIATHLRIIFRDTKNSISILKHLEAKDKISILSTCSEDVPDSVNAMSELSQIVIDIKNSEPFGKFVPKFGDGSFISVEQYLCEPIYKLFNLNRQDMFLWLSNKYGGAHIDNPKKFDEDKLILLQRAEFGSAFYRKVKVSETEFDIQIETPILGPIAPSADGEWIGIKNSDYSDIRQIAYEILNSPDLLNLAGL